ncbi:amidohydrolase family protein [Robertmurraya korlensis]|uniref:amidohydrolase family protein n=1 Tax=Robertmurraya korlensis TaxID=519977 RepID=UPI0022B6009A|nr:amidohydrolase family protein [Robertmurraya korlensis]
MQKADKEKFQIRLHAIGDRAIRLALTAFEEAKRVNGKWDSRHAIEHVEVLHPNDLDRFNQLGVIASMQPEHLFASEKNTYVACIGKEREPYTFNIRSLMDTGATVSFGTDYLLSN